jgi:hypothetical protein
LFLFSLSFEYGHKNSVRQLAEFFRYVDCRDCDHKTICIPKLNVLYQISLSEVFKNIFFFIIMSSNHEKMLVWNASIWVGGPCISRSQSENWVKKITSRGL